MTTAEILVKAFEIAGALRETEPNRETPSYDALEAACRMNKQAAWGSAAYDCLRYTALQYGIHSLTEFDAKTQDESKFNQVWMAAIFMAYIEYD